MLRQTIIEKVLRRIDEYSPQLTDGTMSGYNVSDFLDEAVVQLLSTVPVHLLPVTDFSQSVATPKSDGSGSVALPSGFLRLVEFQMKGWQRPVNSAITISSPLYARQFNRVTRGGTAKPIVVIKDGKLEYFSLPQNTAHEIEQAKCIISTTAETIANPLIDPLCWLTAALIMDVKNELQAAEAARKQYAQNITMLYGNTDH